jgi:CheY-like chemotaxis protein
MSPQTSNEGPGRWPEATLDETPPNARVLIVDDHDVSRCIAATLCELFHCAYECVSSGPEAIEALRRGRFDLVLMDIRMPGMNGLEAASAIRALPDPAARTPIIAVTSDAGAVETRTYLASGMVDVVPKPITPQRLHKAITDAIASTGDEPRSWAPAG